MKGELLNLEFHQERFERTRRELLGLKSHPLLDDVIRIPTGLDQAVMKCRVSYAHEIELIEYEPRRSRELRSLKLVYSDSIEYGFKYSDRSELNKLYQRREGCDDILVVKKGCISDSFYANVIFWNGRAWETPDTPLLPGTMRASLLASGQIRTRRIELEDLDKYEKLKLINAMNDFNQAPEIPVDSIH